MSCAPCRASITDPNYRIFTDDRQIYVFNAERFMSGMTFRRYSTSWMWRSLPMRFYLGKELMKAHIAITLGKVYRQEQALRWGYLTREEPIAMVSV